MNIREAMERVSLSFKYDDLKKALSQEPPDTNKLNEAIVAMNKKEREVLEPIFIQLVRCNLPRNPTPEIVHRFFQENSFMENTRKAIKRWRQSFMPEWQKIVEILEKNQGAQP